MTLRCPECRSRRATFTTLVAHVNASGHKLCGCGGYHYPHRPGSKYCERNPYSIIHLAQRYGEVSEEQLLDMMVEIAMSTPGKAARPNDPIPF